MPHSNLVGKNLGGRYKIVQLLGEGGMSAVYKATDQNLQRDVAVKVIHPHLSHKPEFVSRFEQEAAAVAQLRHPNIVQVFDFNHDDDMFFMVLEFVAGTSLFEILKQRSQAGEHLPYNDAIQHAIHISEAAEYSHKKGMIHRDIKPANVMIDPQGQAVLMDFGIAKIVGGDSFTEPGAVMGTAQYISPEQIRGDSPDHRADIYSNGVVLFEMVSGRPLFKADSVMTLLMMHLNDPVPNLHELQPDIPDALEAIIRKALAKDPAQRYKSAGEMSKALKKVLAGYEPKEGKPIKKVRVSEQYLAQASPAMVAPAAPESADKPGLLQAASVDSESAAQTGVLKTQVIKGSPAMSSEMGEAPAASPDARGGDILKYILALAVGIIGLLVVGGILLGAFLLFRRDSASPAAAATRTAVATDKTNDLDNSSPNQPGELLFSTEFDQPTGENNIFAWSSSDDTNNYSAIVQDGKLILQALPAKTAVWASYELALEYPDVRVTTSATKVSGSNTNHIGLMCRVSEAGWYELVYSSVGYWYINLNLESSRKWTELASGSSNAIRLTEATNEVVATCIGNELALYVNGVLLGSVSDDTFLSGGKVGVVIWGKFPGLVVEFDYLVAELP